MRLGSTQSPHSHPPTQLNRLGAYFSLQQPHIMPVESTKEKKESKKEKKEGFAYKIILCSPARALTTRSLSFLPSTMPSSTAAPNTPPPMIQGILEPAPYYSIPPPYPGQVRPHHYLEPNAVDWGMMDHPSVMSSTDHDSLLSGVLYEPAIDMPVPCIPITSPYLPWTINVRASNGSYITLEDVYGAIYRTLRMNITANEFSTFESESDRRRATRAYEERYRRQRSARAYEEEKQGGMKRIDFLMGHTRFLGIANSDSRPDEWQLVVT